MAFIAKEVDVEVTDEEIINELGNRSHEELIEFVMEVDNASGDWDFTKKLIHRLIKEYLNHEGVNDLELDTYLSHKEESDDENDEEEEEKPVEKETPLPMVAGEHNHIFRNGACYCGALS